MCVVELFYMKPCVQPRVSLGKLDKITFYGSHFKVED